MSRGRTAGNRAAAPPVVSVMVVHEPGDWFSETLSAMAAQDYPNLRHVFFVNDESFDEVAPYIEDAVPGAFVRRAANPGSFGATVNEILKIVEGGNGMLLVCHDDVAPAADAVSLLVAELQRSKAGIVGPKLVDWDDARVLQHVGLGIDRLGEIDPLIEPGEVDQEQHDRVRDVFVIPSAFALIRADLFRALKGFDPAISFYGDDVELCWRAHLLGARVVVVPDSVVRHREQLEVRVPNVNVQALQSRHRMRAVATLTSGSRLFVRSLQMILLTIAELIVGLFTGRVGEALYSVRALVGLVPRTGSLVARRKAIAEQRKVPEREVLGLQVRGSARLNSFLRGRETATYVGEHTTVRRWRQVGYGPLLTWVVVLGALGIGSRKFISDRVPPVGEFLPFPSAGDLFAAFRSSFDSRGLGGTVANPTSWLITSAGSFLTLFQMGLYHTVFVLGLVILGAMGAWRLGAIFPAASARIATTIVYVATPLVPWALGTGELAVLVWFAGLPWVVHLIGKGAGLRPADPEASNPNLSDGVARMAIDERVKVFAAAVLVLGVVVAFVPAAVLLVLLVALVLAGATLVAGGRIDVAAWWAVGGVAALVGGYVLNVPWVFSWTWTHLAGVDGGATGRSLVDVLSLSSSSVRFSTIALGLYAPVLVGALITSAWRFTWSVRGLALVVVFGGLAVMKSFGIWGGVLPPVGLLLVPLVLGLAVSAGALVSGLEVDVLAKGFGWRQPVSVVANVALVIGLVPAAVTTGAGNWGAPELPAVELFQAQFVPDSEVGSYRVLYVGDPDVLPLPGREFEKGIGFTVTTTDQLTFEDASVIPATDGDELIREALLQVGTGSTARAGRLLAPLGFRYIVIPQRRAVDSTEEGGSELAVSLNQAFSRQLDLGRVPSPPTMLVYENQSFIPVASGLTGATATDASKAGVGALVRVNFGSATPLFPEFPKSLDDQGAVEPGVLHLAVPFDENFALSVGGADAPARPTFGVGTGFDVANGGAAELSYRPGAGRTVWLILFALLWLGVGAVAFAPRVRFGRSTSTGADDGTLIDLVGDTRLEDFEQYEHVRTEGRRYGVDEDGDVVEYDPDRTGALDRTASIDPGLTSEISRADIAAGIDETTQTASAFLDDDDDEEGWL